MPCTPIASFCMYIVSRTVLNTTHCADVQAALQRVWVNSPPASSGCTKQILAVTYTWHSISSAGAVVAMSNQDSICKCTGRPNWSLFRLPHLLYDTLTAVVCTPVAFAPSPISTFQIHTYTHMHVGASQSLLQCLLLQPAFDFFSQLLALLCVPLSRKAHNAWYTHTQMTNSRSTGATRR